MWSLYQTVTTKWSVFKNFTFNRELFPDSIQPSFTFILLLLKLQCIEFYDIFSKIVKNTPDLVDNNCIAADKLCDFLHGSFFPPLLSKLRIARRTIGQKKRREGIEYEWRNGGSNTRSNMNEEITLWPELKTHKFDHIVSDCIGICCQSSFCLKKLVLRNDGYCLVSP